MRAKGQEGRPRNNQATEWTAAGAMAQARGADRLSATVRDPKGQPDSQEQMHGQGRADRSTYECLLRTNVTRTTLYS